jgi:hypothetical protein
VQDFGRAYLSFRLFGDFKVFYQKNDENVKKG